MPSRVERKSSGAKFPGYSPRDWAEIKDILRRLAVDADTVMVSSEILPGLTFTDSRPKILLREKLRLLGIFFDVGQRTVGESKLRGSKAIAKYLSMKLAATERYRESVRDAVLSWGSSIDEQLKLYERLQAVLADVAADLRKKMDYFAAHVTDRGQNAAKVWEGTHLYGLALVWHELGGAQAPHKLAIDFLFTCTQPVFSTTRKAIERWVERMPKKQRQALGLATPKRS